MRSSAWYLRAAIVGSGGLWQVQIDHEREPRLDGRERTLEERLELGAVLADAHERGDRRDLLVQVRIARVGREVLVVPPRSVAALGARVHQLQLLEDSRRKLLVDVLVDQPADIGRALRGAGPVLPPVQSIDL